MKSSRCWPRSPWCGCCSRTRPGWGCDEIEADGRKVAQVSKWWFRVRDAHGVEMAPDQNPALLLAVT
jgi:hypothetical protein